MSDIKEVVLVGCGCNYWSITDSIKVVILNAADIIEVVIVVILNMSDVLEVLIVTI